jgi:DNA-binding NtrC family response regulator
MPALAEKFLAEEARKLGRGIGGFSGEFFDFLKDYSFPGNLQELRTIVAAAAANTESGLVSLDSLPTYIRETIRQEKASPREGFRPGPLSEVVREYVQKSLEHFGHRRDVAAEALGISREEIDRLTDEDFD